MSPWRIKDFEYMSPASSQCVAECDLWYKLDLLQQGGAVPLPGPPTSPVSCYIFRLIQIQIKIQFVIKLTCLHGELSIDTLQEWADGIGAPSQVRISNSKMS